MVLRSALCDSVDRGLPTFERLQDVSFNLRPDCSRENGIRNTADVLPFFYLLTVQHISVSIDNPVTFAWPTKHTPTPSRLASLNLSFIREDYLGHVLSATTGLKTLRWKWYYRENFPDQFRQWIMDRFGKDVIDLNQIGAAMLHFRDTLTDLTISAACDMSQAQPATPPLTIKGSLNDIVNLNALERFEAPLPFLMGFSPDAAWPLEQVIPGNIKFLTITNDLWLQEENEMHDVTLLSAIRSWLEDWRLSTPNLRGISLLLRKTDDEWGPEMRNEPGSCVPQPEFGSK
jgi:hypothetical protein